MCGIVGYTGKSPCGGFLYEGLKRLEYRGYDSAGAAFCTTEGIFCQKKRGKVQNVRSFCLRRRETTGIAHTRWATHGKPNDLNAHPHVFGHFALVHNGIVENAEALRSQLLTPCRSETDSEVLLHTIAACYEGDLLQAVRNALTQCSGSWAIAVISDYHPEEIVCARRQSPLVVGKGKNGIFVASDVYALHGLCEQIFLPPEDSLVRLRRPAAEREEAERIEGIAGDTGVTGGAGIAGVEAFDMQLSPLPVLPQAMPPMPPIQSIGHRTHMEAEIEEIPRAVSDTARSLAQANLPDLPKVQAVFATGCGTAFHACVAFRYRMQRYGKPIIAEQAGELRSGCVRFPKNSLLVAVTQSGETADTLAAIRLAKSQNVQTLVITNVRHSSAAREADFALFTEAGTETAVAATKSFNCQLMALYFLAAKCVGRPVPDFTDLPSLCEAAVEADVTQAVKKLYKKRGMFCLGQNADYAIAREGALKIKEICYLFSEGYPAAELKHGSLSLIESGFPVLAIVTQKSALKKMKNTLREAKSRGATTLVLSQYREALAEADVPVLLPMAEEDLMPILAVIPLQKIAVELCLKKKLSPDYPRNLAKSVTVE